MRASITFLISMTLGLFGMIRNLNNPINLIIIGYLMVAIYLFIRATFPKDANLMSYLMNEITEIGRDGYPKFIK